MGRLNRWGAAGGWVFRSRCNTSTTFAEVASISCVLPAAQHSNLALEHGPEPRIPAPSRCGVAREKGAPNSVVEDGSTSRKIVSTCQIRFYKCARQLQSWPPVRCCLGWVWTRRSGRLNRRGGAAIGHRVRSLRTRCAVQDLRCTRSRTLPSRRSLKVQSRDRSITGMGRVPAVAQPP